MSRSSSFQASPAATGPSPIDASPDFGRRRLLGGAIAAPLHALGAPARALFARAAGASLLAASAPAARAQLSIDVSGIGAQQIPISIGKFTTEGAVPLDVSSVVIADLQRSGAFRLYDAGASLSETATPDYAAFRARGVDYIVGGSTARLADGRYDVRFRLIDATRQSPVGGQSMVVTQPDLRLAGHRIADWIYERLTGDKGIFSTRIAFVTKQGGRYRLNIADWDGENVVTPLTSNEPIISPAWSPDGQRLAYVSFQSRKPVVYVHTLATGRQQVVADFRGSNSAPAWSPDGRTLAVALTRDGFTQVYTIGVDGSGLKRVTNSSSIDTEPAFSPDGRTLYFTSDRGGSPQIYRMPVAGGDAQRVTFGGSYNVSPRVSPDGRTLAFVTRRGNGYTVAVKDLAGDGAERVVSDTGADESPSFAPSGRWVLYTTNAGGRDVLMAVTVDGRVRQRLAAPAGDIREPAWGPFSP